MINIQDTIISLDVLEKKFVCDLNACKGACCVEGDSGAPLLEEEEKILAGIYKKVKPYMSKKGVSVIERHGFGVYDSDGELTTPLVNRRECAFVIFENGVAKCSIEKAYEEKKIEFQKPISCHLFPVRITKYPEFDALNYEEIKICKPGCECGAKLKVPVYRFLKKPLLRKYGKEWYNELLKVVECLDL